MFTVHPTLLIGPSDWQPERMPREEFVRRLDALWLTCPTATRMLVYGDSRHHAELAYLTNLVPKLEATVALFSRTEAPRLFVGGGPNMLGAAQPLTWISDLVALKALERLRLPDCVLIGGGYMPAGLRKTVADALDETAPDASAQVWTLMRRKSSAELEATRGACAALDSAIAAMVRSFRYAPGVTDVVLAGENAANKLGAQDVRVLFSVNSGRTLQPFSRLIEKSADPLQVYVAVRRLNYWAESFAMLSERPHRGAQKADEVLRVAIGTVRAGMSAAVAERLIASAMRPYHAHPVTAGSFGHAMGLALEEPPYTEVATNFEAGGIYSLRIGVTDTTEIHAIVSAMVALQDGRNEVLWSRPGP